MTILACINRTDDLKPNIYDQGVKVEWLSLLDQKIKCLVFDRCREGDASFFTGYGPDTDLQTQLLVGGPFEQMYQRWLEAQIDLANGEIDRYNVSITLFNAEFDAFQRHYMQTHQAKGAGGFRY